MTQPHLLQEARAFQRSEAFAPYRKLRQVAEHRLARLMQLGVRQARYFGRTKTLFQLLMAATVANLTLVATRTGLLRDRNHPKTSSLYTSAIPDGIRSQTLERTAWEDVRTAALVPKFTGARLISQPPDRWSPMVTSSIVRRSIISPD